MSYSEVKVLTNVAEGGNKMKYRWEKRVQFLPTFPADPWLEKAKALLEKKVDKSNLRALNRYYDLLAEMSDRISHERMVRIWFKNDPFMRTAFGTWIGSYDELIGDLERWIQSQLERNVDERELVDCAMSLKRLRRERASLVERLAQADKEIPLLEEAGELIRLKIECISKTIKELELSRGNDTSERQAALAELTERKANMGLN